MIPLRSYNILCLSVIMFLSCSKQILDEKEFSAWLSEESNGMIVRRVVGNMEFVVTHIPDKWFAYQECMKSTGSKLEYDSIYSSEASNIRFEIEIRPATLEKGKFNDIMFNNISSYEEYTNRFYSLNFDLASRISLSIDGETLEPVFALLENTYGLTSGRKATVFFHAGTKDWKNRGNIVFNYSDDDFGSGSLHFVFKRESLQNIPALQPKVFRQ